MIRKQAAVCAILMTVSSAFCGTAFAAPLQGTEKAAVSAESALHVDSSRWNYDKDNDIYYQIGLVYCKIRWLRSMNPCRSMCREPI